MIRYGSMGRPTTADWWRAFDAIGGRVIESVVLPSGVINKLSAVIVTADGAETPLRLEWSTHAQHELGTQGVAIYVADTYRGRTPVVGHGQEQQLPAYVILNDILQFLRIKPVVPPGTGPPPR